MKRIVLNVSNETFARMFDQTFTIVSIPMYKYNTSLDNNKRDYNNFVIVPKKLKYATKLYIHFYFLKLSIKYFFLAI